jgi:hypothetical protein
MIKTLKIFFILLVFFVGIKSVSATTISPAVIDVNLDPGKSAVYEIKLYNETENDLILDGVIEKFIPRGDQGEVEVLPPDVSDISVTWIKLPVNSLILKPGDIISVPIVVSIPGTADVGGYYLAVMWESSSAPSTGGNQAKITSRVGVLILLNVDGDVDNGLEIIDFDLKKNSNFYTNLPIEFTAKFRNIGNTHQRPGGAVIIKDFLGRTSEVISYNSQNSAILPNTTRVFNFWWGKDNTNGVITLLMNQFNNFAIGKFSARAVVDYGDGQELSSDEIYFWVFPWKLILVVLLLFIFVISIGKKIKKKI